MPLVKVLSVGYIAIGLLGLLLVLGRENRQEMFFKSASALGGTFAFLQALLIFLLAIACGAAVWFLPSIAPLFAWGVFGLVVFGQVANLASGRGIRCLRCLATSLPLTSASAYAMSVGTQ
jgi:hypothetical protein